MAIPKHQLETLLRLSFPEAKIEVIDLMGDNDHYEVHIQSTQFQGLSMINQHRLVYNALGDRVGTTLHAMALKTSVK